MMDFYKSKNRKFIFFISLIVFLTVLVCEISTYDVFANEVNISENAISDENESKSESETISDTLPERETENTSQAVSDDDIYSDDASDYGEDNNLATITDETDFESEPDESASNQDDASEISENLVVSADNAPYEPSENSVSKADDNEIIISEGADTNGSSTGAKKKPSLKNPQIQLYVYKTSKIKAKGVNGLQGSFVSTKPSIAEVNPLTGVVKALAPGKAVIKCTYSNPLTGYSITLNQKVTVPKVSLNYKTLKISNGKKVKLFPISGSKKLKYLLKNSSDRAITFRSSKPKVAYVDSKGVVYPISKGSATVTCIIESTGEGKTMRLKCKVKVSGKKFCKMPSAATDIKFDVKDFYTDDEAFKNEALRELSDEIPVASATNVIIADSGNASTNNTALQNAVNNAIPGTTIYLRAGDYKGGINISKSGNSSGYITIRNYPGESPRVLCTSGDSSDTEHVAFRFDEKSYIRIDGLEISDFSNKKSYGILINRKSNHIIIKNNNIHNIATSKPGEGQGGEANGILCFGEGDTEASSINNIFIGNNSLHDNTTGWCETLSMSGNVKNINVYNNTVYNNTNIGIDFAGNAGYCTEKSLDQPRNCIAYGNTVYNCKSPYAWCAGLYIDGGRNVVLKNNTIYNCQYGIEVGSENPPGNYPVRNILVKSNNVYGNPYGGILVGGYDDTSQTGVVKDVIIDSNTLKNNDNNSDYFNPGSDDSDCGYNGEIHFNKVQNIHITNNNFYKKNNTYPMIGRGLDLKYVKNLKFSNNTYRSPSPSGIYFELGDDSITGVADFNSYTGGNDKSAKWTP